MDRYGRNNQIDGRIRTIYLGYRNKLEYIYYVEKAVRILVVFEPGQNREVWYDGTYFIYPILDLGGEILFRVTHRFLL